MNVDLKGLVLVSRDFGYCKITSHMGGIVEIHFIGSGRTARYNVQIIAAQKDFKSCPMPVGLKCHTNGNRVCMIVEASFQPSETQGVYEYVVVFDDGTGETTRLSERDLWPIPGSLSETPLSKITSLRADPLTNFRAREGLLAALQQIERESTGIRALAASRISLLPHQAFVIGTVIDDPLWRYVLADEVGLGKTIEAGAIAHQLLTEKPDARVLILSPGPLSRQWLCEMHLSFGGRDFRLLDLYEPNEVSLKDWRLVISSLKLAARAYSAKILATKWDLVVVDEAHQLLWNDGHYQFVEQLAVKAPRLLLLSAVPARERENELLRLLRLIDPGRYQAGGPVASRFSELYSAQSTIGRRLRIVARQINKPDDLDSEQLQEDVERLLTIEVLRDDTDLRALQRATQNVAQPSDAFPYYRQLVDEVVSRYRISRRILKNRRARLVDSELLCGVARTVKSVHYKPSPLEAQISAVAIDLLQLLASTRNADALQVLFRKVAQSLCDPVALYEIANALLSGESDASVDLRMFDANAAFDYDEHDAVLEGCGTVFVPQIDVPGLKQWVSLLRAAIEIPEHPRISALKTCLRELLADEVCKVLVFAGTFGSAEYVTESLVAEFDKEAIASFRHDLNDDEKEKQVARFRRDPRCRVLVSDESGGEGRNFQFADELVHFDLPWSVSAMEQRIGRLDRIGRTRPVRSFVIFPSGGLEAAWFRCLEEGFGVFTHSISGLEFMLHATERLVVRTAVEGGPAALIDMIPSIREASERERATDDAEALTDAASFRSTTRYLRTPENVGDEMLENFLPSYLRALSRESAAKQITDNKDVSLKIWRLKPEEVTDYKLSGLERQGENPLQDRYGTFSRLVARERPDLNFFAAGHPVVDALAVATREHVRGRSLIARISTDAVQPGLVILSAWRVSNIQQGSDPIPERALRLLGGRSVWIGLDLETGEALDAAVAGRIADQLISNTSAVHDLNSERAIKTFNPEQGQWSATLRSLLVQAEALAINVYQDKFREKDAVFCEQLLADAEEVSRTRLDEGTVYVQRLEATVAAIRQAKLGLDVLALLKIETPPPA